MSACTVPCDQVKNGGIRMSLETKDTSGIIHMGNVSRIQKVMADANQGKEITVGFIGGSITMGSVATSPERCYAARVHAWWESAFPKAKINYVNAGIGATTSQFAVARAEEDLLAYSPDFVIVEFSVNDDANAFFQETYEGLLRKILTHKCQPAVMIVNNMFYDTGVTAAEFHNRIGIAYDLPIISMKASIYEEIQQGIHQIPDLTSDNLHPNDTGHALIASKISHFLEVLRDTETDKAEYKVPEPVTRNRYQNSVRLRNMDLEVKGQGFVRDNTSQNVITEIFRKGWLAGEKGAWLETVVTGRNIAVQYRKTIHRPAPIASISIDDGHKIILDANFTEEWGDCLYLQTLAEGLDEGEHRVRVELTQATRNDASPFYLVSLIVS